MQQQIYFINEPPINYKLKHKTILRKWINHTIESEKKQLTQLTYIFCSDEFLLELNQQHLNHDYYTDIITFDNSDNIKEVESDIFISVDRVRDNAKTIGCLLHTELHRVIIHGVLHLCGYKDKSLTEQQKMREKEDLCLEKLEEWLG